MNRPLLITDCDEVLLHMVKPFRDWLVDVHGIDFHWNGNDFSKAVHYLSSGDLVPGEETWRLLNVFFETQMDKQYPIAGALEAIGEIAREADVVVLTNLGHQFNAARTAQLAGHGFDLKVYTNLGPKGPALQKIIAEYAPSRALFVDDIAHHHGSVADLAPQVHRLHLCGEPLLAPHIPCAREAGQAHARIDNWNEALPWIAGKLYGEAHD
ncbi:MAG: HAD family hydrolase [Novosphingobium sp.]